MPQFYRQRADPKNVAAIILGGGAGTQLFPLTKRTATPAVKYSLHFFFFSFLFCFLLFWGGVFAYLMSILLEKKSFVFGYQVVQYGSNEYTSSRVNRRSQVWSLITW